MHDGSRSAELAELDLPTLVIHGSRDTLIDPSGGRRTAEVIPGARYVEIEGMGHDYPPPVWQEWVAVWSEFAHAAAVRTLISEVGNRSPRTSFLSDPVLPQ